MDVIVDEDEDERMRLPRDLGAPPIQFSDTILRRSSGAALRWKEEGKFRCCTLPFPPDGL